MRNTFEQAGGSKDCKGLPVEIISIGRALDELHATLESETEDTEGVDSNGTNPWQRRFEC